MNKPANAFYAQSGGVTSVINASACGVIETANKSSKINKVLGKNGILGALNEELFDTSKEKKSEIAKLRQTLGSFRFLSLQTSDPIKQKKEYLSYLRFLKPTTLSTFYNGGGDSPDTTLKFQRWPKNLNCL